jgi:hypothetical protein
MCLRKAIFNQSTISYGNKYIAYFRLITLFTDFFSLFNNKYQLHCLTTLNYIRYLHFHHLPFLVWLRFVLGGLVVIVFANGPKVRGFKPGRGRWIWKVIKIRCTTSFGGEVKPSAPCRKILRHVKDPWGVRQRYFAGKINGHFPPSSFLLH